MKKQLQLSLISIAVASLALSSASFAANAKGDGYKGENYKGEAMAPCPQPLTLNGGFYIGADVGYDMYQAEHEFSATNGVNVSDNPTLSASGWAGGLFAGYGMYFNDAWYLGAEVFGNWSGADTSHTLSTNSTATTTLGIINNAEFSSSGNVGVDVIPGMKLNPATLAYVRLGYNWADLEGQNTVTVDGTALPKTTDSDWEGGFHWGVGI